MNKLVNDNPETNMEVMMNLAFVKNKEVWIWGGGADGKDCTLVDFSRRMCMCNPECQFDDGFPSDSNDLDAIGDMYMDCSMTGCPIGTAYFIAIQAAELRERLRKFENDSEPDPKPAVIDNGKAFCPHCMSNIRLDMVSAYCAYCGKPVIWDG